MALPNGSAFQRAGAAVTDGAEGERKNVERLQPERD